MRVFVSYCHAQGEWVWDRLIPVLEAGGCEVLIDRERFAAGKALLGQMDAVQDKAERHLLIISPEYLESSACEHEMMRAISFDSDFTHGLVIPAMREKCVLPDAIKKPNPIYADLSNDVNADEWDKMLLACAADLGVSAPHWLDIRDSLKNMLEHNRSVNLMVKGENVAWRAMIHHLSETQFGDLVQVDLNSGHTISRPDLLQQMLGTANSGKLPEPPNDLSRFQEIIEQRPGITKIALLHFDLVQRRNYGPDLFSVLRYLTHDKRKLVLLVHSRQPFLALAYPDPDPSPLTMLQLELKGRR